MFILPVYGLLKQRKCYRQNILHEDMFGLSAPGAKLDVSVIIVERLLCSRDPELRLSCLLNHKNCPSKLPGAGCDFCSIMSVWASKQTAGNQQMFTSQSGGQPLFVCGYFQASALAPRRFPPGFSVCFLWTHGWPYLDERAELGMAFPVSWLDNLQGMLGRHL